MPDWPWTWPRASVPIPNRSFPNLIPGTNGNHKRTSWSSSRYNCIAWAAGDALRPWWPEASPNAYWPPTAIDEDSLRGFVSAFNTLGYHCCLDGSLEPGFEKIALYAWPDGTMRHAARQLVDGSWTSKLGKDYWPDIRHNTPDVVSGLTYGSPVCYMRRQKKAVAFSDIFAWVIQQFWIIEWELITFIQWCRFGGTMYNNG